MNCRGFGDGCPIAHGVRLVGDRWSLLIARELLVGPLRYSDLKRGLPLISSNVLAQRLDALAAVGILERQLLPRPANVHVYCLTEWGMALEPVVLALGRWALGSPLHDPTLPRSGTSLALSLRAMFDGAAPSARKMDIGLQVGSEHYVAEVCERRLSLVRSSRDSVQASFAGTAEALARLIYRLEPAEHLLAAGDVAISGDRLVAEAFLGCFPGLDRHGRVGNRARRPRN